MAGAAAPPAIAPPVPVSPPGSVQTVASWLRAARADRPAAEVLFVVGEPGDGAASFAAELARFVRLEPDDLARDYAALADHIATHDVLSGLGRSSEAFAQFLREHPDDLLPHFAELRADSRVEIVTVDVPQADMRPTRPTLVVAPTAGEAPEDRGASRTSVIVLPQRLAAPTMHRRFRLVTAHRLARLGHIALNLDGRVPGRARTALDLHDTLPFLPVTLCLERDWLAGRSTGSRCPRGATARGRCAPCTPTSIRTLWSL
jgi:hypothetical protein